MLIEHQYGVMGAFPEPRRHPLVDSNDVPESSAS